MMLNALRVTFPHALFAPSGYVSYGSLVNGWHPANLLW